MAENETQNQNEGGEIRRPVIRMLGKPSGRSGGFSRRRICRFCGDESVKIDYKNTTLLKNFITERGKLVPARITGTCAKHQRALSTAVRRSRMIALLPFTVTGKDR